MSIYISNPEEAKEYLPRYRFFYIAIFFTFIIILMRLWYLQIIEGDELREFSEKNRLKQNKIMAARGLILDREGKILVENHPGFEMIISPQYIQNLEDLAAKVGPIISAEPAKIVQRIQRSKRQNGPFATIKLKDNLTRDEVFRLKRIRLETPGLEIRESIVRHYPLSENGAQLFGYVGEISKKQLPIYNQLYKGFLTFEQGDIIGKNGLEEILEKDIHGSEGVQFLQVDAFGREATAQTPNIYGEQIRDKEAIPGNNVVLTLDRDLQEAAWKAFMELNRIGGAVAIRPNGEILAWVSSPSFDPNQFAQNLNPAYWSKLINDPFKPLRNKVIQDHFAPGSTFKALMAATALQEKVISPSTIINCPGALRFGRRLYHDAKKEGHGNISVYEALERSSNIFFYKMGISLGIDRMYNYISQMGIGSKTGIELAREASGLMPSAQWKKAAKGEEWQPGENLSNAIGQGFVQATPLQMAIAYNAIATEGNVVKPFIIKKVIDIDGKVIKETSEKIVRNITDKESVDYPISVENLRVVKEGLRRVVQGERGTARALRIPGIEMAGKTGTTQVMAFAADKIYDKCDLRPIHQRHHGWFVGWAPADKPEITVAALAEHSCSGSGGAGPLVKQIINAYFQKHYPEKMAEAIKKEKELAILKWKQSQQRKTTPQPAEETESE
jgi:penicillin-binding protein 2